MVVACKDIWRWSLETRVGHDDKRAALSALKGKLRCVPLESSKLKLSTFAASTI